MDRCGVRARAGACLLAFALGCVGPRSGAKEGASESAEDAQTSYSSRVGDAQAVPLGQVTISWPLEGAERPYEFLEVEMVALIRGSGSMLSSEAAVVGVLRRLGPRLEATVLAELLPRQRCGWEALASARAHALGCAQKVLDAEFSRWEQAKDYRVEIVFTAFHLVPPGPGKAGPQVQLFR